jgi:D-tyrosyl-tRNA(Tyr) deacylase
MRAVVQRVKEAKVQVEGKVVGEIGHGVAVFLGVEQSDEIHDADYLVTKTVQLRIFKDSEQKFNRSLVDVRGAMLVVSQFTLLGDCRKGRRPSFSDAASPEKARDLYEYFISRVAKSDIPVASGEFQAMMEVFLINDGPVTMLLDSKRKF